MIVGKKANLDANKCVETEAINKFEVEIQILFAARDDQI